LLLIDGAVAFAGGTAVIDEVDSPLAPELRWRETMIEIQGPVLGDWQQLFTESWDMYADEALTLPAPTPPVIANGQPGRVTVNEAHSRTGIQRSLLKQLQRANQRVWFATAYFIPSWKLRRKLKYAARAGVDVRLLLPGPCHRPQFAGKSAFLLATAGTAHSKHALRTMAFALRTWGFHISGKVSLITGALMRKGEINDHFHPKIEKAAEKMLLSLHKIQPNHPSFIALMTFRIQQAFWQKNQDNSVDYQYWHEQGWMEKDCNFYIPHSASANKVFLARLIGQVIGAFVT
jgi:hypothetical protein